jgi:hypothetical protein
MDFVAADPNGRLAYDRRGGRLAQNTCLIYDDDHERGNLKKEIKHWQCGMQPEEIG